MNLLLAMNWQVERQDGDSSLFYENTYSIVRNPRAYKIDECPECNEKGYPDNLGIFLEGR